MSSIIRVATLGALGIVAAGCGVSDEDTRNLWGSVRESLGATEGSSQQQALAVTVSFELDVDCARGGSAAFDAGLDADDSRHSVFTALFGYKVTYDACRPDENTLDGELDYTAAIDAASTDDGGLLRVETVYRGSVTSRGKTNGTCEVDVVGHLDAAAFENPGDEFHGHVDVAYSGTICGHDADETLSARADIDG